MAYVNYSPHAKGAALFLCAGINGSLSIMVTGNNSAAPPLTGFELMCAHVNDLFTAMTSFCALRFTAGRLTRSSPNSLAKEGERYGRLPSRARPQPAFGLFPVEAEKRHRANFGECLLLEVEPSFRLSCGAAVDRLTFEVRSYMPSLIQINAYFNEALRIANA